MHFQRLYTAVLLCGAFSGTSSTVNAQSAVRLPGITVTPRTNSCPEQNSTSALEVWRAMAKRYRPLLSTLPPSAQIVRAGGYSRESIAASDIGSFVAAEKAGEPGIAAVRANLRGELLASADARAASLRRQARTYASRIPANEPAYQYQPLYLNWYYLRFDENDVDALITPWFGEQQIWSIDSVPGGIALRFCTSDRHSAWISGQMELTRDTLLSHVAIAYHTSKPSEDAASEVWFDLQAPLISGARYLWADKSLFYRKEGTPEVWYQEAWTRLRTCVWIDAANARVRNPPDYHSRPEGCAITNL